MSTQTAGKEKSIPRRKVWMTKSTTQTTVEILVETIMPKFLTYIVGNLFLYPSLCMRTGTLRWKNPSRMTCLCKSKN